MSGTMARHRRGRWIPPTPPEALTDPVVESPIILEWTTGYCHLYWQQTRPADVIVEVHEVGFEGMPISYEMLGGNLGNNQKDFLEYYEAGKNYRAIVTGVGYDPHFSNTVET